MDVNILGPLEVRDREGREVRLPAGRERSLLALLLINRGEVVSADRIVAALWGDRPPETAGKAVQGYVSHLRRALNSGHGAGGADSCVLTRAPGYALRTDGVVVDAARFERLAGDGRRALEDGSTAAAASLLEEALELWRGPALADFAFDDFAQDEIRRLEELRLSATEDRIDALLRLGRDGGLVGRLESLVAEHPLRERLRGQAMLALYRNGRQADALQVYREGRLLLAGDLGLEPGPELQRLERAILVQDPALEAAAPAPPPAREAEPEEPRPPPSPPRARRRLAFGGVLLAVAIAAAVLAIVLSRDGGPGPVPIVAPAAVAVDPHSNRVVAAVRVGSRPVSIAAGEGGVWVGDGRDGTVTRIDPVSRRVLQTIGIGAPAVDLAAGAGSVWAATGAFGTILRIDPGLGAVSQRIPLGEPSDPEVPVTPAVGVGDGRVWAGALNGLLRIDPRSGRITGRVDLGRSAAQQIAVGGGAVWATTFRSRAKRVEAASAQVTADFYAGRSIFPVALDRSAVWVGGVEDGRLWKLDPATGSTLLTSRAGGGTTGIALGLGALWVASWRDDTLVRVDPGTGEVQATIPVGGSATEAAVGGGLVWVIVNRTPIPTS